MKPAVRFAARAPARDDDDKIRSWDPDGLIAEKGEQRADGIV
jgi:hypothetical protein